MGRPSIYCDEITDEICQRIALAEPLSHICKDAHLPNISTIIDWQHRYPDFAAKIARAREDSAETISYEIKEIADTPHPMEAVTTMPDGSQMRVVKDSVEHRKLRIDSRIKLMQMLKPKTYSPKTAITGADGGPVEVVFRRVGLED